MRSSLSIGGMNLRPQSRPPPPRVSAPVVDKAPPPKKSAAPASEGMLKAKPRTRPVGAGAKKRPEVLQAKKADGPKYRRGVPSVSAKVAKTMDKYKTEDDIKSKIVQFNRARALKKRGFIVSEDVNVIGDDGQLMSNEAVKALAKSATTGKGALIRPGAEVEQVRSAMETSAAAVAATPDMIGFTNPDLRVAFENFLSVVDLSRNPSQVSTKTVAAGIEDGLEQGGVGHNKSAAPGLVAEEFKAPQRNSLFTRK